MAKKQLPSEIANTASGIWKALGFDTYLEAGRTLAGGIFRWLGPIFLVLSIGVSVKTCMFLRDTTSTEGTIVSLSTVGDQEDGTLSYRPVFRFSNAEGAIYTVTSDAGSNPPGFTVGQRIHVLYRARTPADARIRTFWQLWTFTVVFGIIGLVATGVGFGLRWFESWLNRRAGGFIPPLTGFGAG